MGDAAKLEDFERAVYGRKREDRIAENDEATRAMLQCLSALRGGAGFEGYAEADTPLYTRMASAIVALFVDPHYKLTVDGFNQIAAERVVIETVFAASVYGGTDFIFRLIPKDAEGVTKYLLLFSVNSELDPDCTMLESVFRNDPQTSFPLYLSLISYGQIFTESGERRRQKLIDLAPLFEGVDIQPVMFNTMTGAYMHISYADHPGKHEPKRVFHRLMASQLAEVSPVGRHLERKVKPTILVLFEWWHSKHAMFRSYAKSIQQLKRDFYLIGACPSKTDEESRAIFDEWLEVQSDPMVLTQIADQIKAKKPDIIYYPSIGMAIWTIAMASLRLAPIQVMTYGHPATSNSQEIDYGIIEEDCLVESCFGEQMIALPNNVVRPTEFEEIRARHVPRRADTVKIAVSAMQVKLTWPFIRALQEVQKRSPKPVEFRFFSAAHGVGLFSLCRGIGGLLDNAWVQEKQDYADYCQSLAECDMALFSFPFGGANSCYDALGVGLPIVSLEGREPHSRSDASIVRRAGLPESLIASTVEGYIEAILRLVDDDERIRIANLVQAIDQKRLFYTPDDSDAFVDAFRSIYERHVARAAA